MPVAVPRPGATRRAEAGGGEVACRRAKVALIGHDLPEDTLFDSVEFQVGGLTELSGIHPLKKVAVPNTLENDPEASATWDSESTWQKWITTEGDEVELTFDPEIALEPGVQLLAHRRTSNRRVGQAASSRRLDEPVRAASCRNHITGDTAVTAGVLGPLASRWEGQASGPAVRFRCRSAALRRHAA
jgi:hypothetical protein